MSDLKVKVVYPFQSKDVERCDECVSCGNWPYLSSATVEREWAVLAGHVDLDQANCLLGDGWLPGDEYPEDTVVLFAGTTCLDGEEDVRVWPCLVRQRGDVTTHWQVDSHWPFFHRRQREAPSKWIKMMTPRAGIFPPDTYFALAE